LKELSLLLESEGALAGMPYHPIAAPTLALAANGKARYVGLLYIAIESNLL
jgi:hypothetical protein